MMGTIQTAKAAFGWRAASQRDDACQRCIHVDRRQTVSITSWWCKRLCCWTSALAICDELAITPEEVTHG